MLKVQQASSVAREDAAAERIMQEAEVTRFGWIVDFDTYARVAWTS